MSELLQVLQNWGGIVVFAILCVIGIVLSLSGASTHEERLSKQQDEDHFVMRLPAGRVGRPLLVLLIGAAVQAVLYFTRRFFPAGSEWIVMLVCIGLAVIFGLIFWSEFAKVIRRHVFVDGERIVVTPALDARIETTFSQIRTVANKFAGGAGGVVGKSIRTKEGKKFQVINSMSGYDHFCEMLESRVELPDLTKKKRKDRKEEPVLIEEAPATEFPQPGAFPQAQEAVPSVDYPEPGDPAHSAQVSMPQEGAAMFDAQPANPADLVAGESVPDAVPTQETID